ncbi:hypothetical protein B6U74_01670 [Candidatus Bathyarchaeota archaeon ex4484_205]|nr:MAG: hypothetical protein B6U74_01670 [Candidatus Bathyarchaeota archaeon ex4484_205]RLG68798.1 MAG: DUF371 domain-containing protein [archaeon]HDN17444.1 DUF371 domain-containing protein [Candidatus Bathyarchaeota archaeon]
MKIRWLEEIHAWGHPNVKATHSTTMEITKDSYLTKRGDCIIAVASNKSVSELATEIKEEVWSGEKVIVEIECNGLKDVVTGYGSPKLSLTDSKSIVIRRSSFICDRTLLIKADKAARDLRRELIKEIKKGNMVLIRLGIPS